MHPQCAQWTLNCVARLGEEQNRRATEQLLFDLLCADGNQTALATAAVL